MAVPAGCLHELYHTASGAIDGIVMQVILSGTRGDDGHIQRVGVVVWVF
jgi:hypothetical protein